METYKELKARQQIEFNEFPIFYAFTEKRFAEGMIGLGLKPTDVDKVYATGSGGYYRRSDSGKLKELLERHDREFREAISSDKDGSGFIYSMFYYELANHEYGYTRDYSYTLDALGLSMEEIESNVSLSKGFKKALKSFNEG